MYARSLRELFKALRSVRRSVCVVVDKESMGYLAKLFERLGWGVEYGRDPEDGVVDYVVVRKPDNKIILSVHPHGRSSTGVDPPYRDEIEGVVVALGLRGCPRHVIPVPKVFEEMEWLRDGLVVLGEDLPVYGVVRGGWFTCTTFFSLKYDLHLLI